MLKLIKRFITVIFLATLSYSAFVFAQQIKQPPSLTTTPSNDFTHEIPPPKPMSQSEFQSQVKTMNKKMNDEFNKQDQADNPPKPRESQYPPSATEARQGTHNNATIKQAPPTNTEAAPEKTETQRAPDSYSGYGTKPANSNSGPNNSTPGNDSSDSQKGNTSSGWNIKY